MSEKNDNTELSDMLALGNFEHQISKNDSFPDCFRLFDEFSRCMGGRSQIRHMYKYKTVENCNSVWVDWTSCLHAKLSSDDKVKQVLFSLNTKYLRFIHMLNFYSKRLYDDSNLASARHIARTSNDIFSYKTKPSWSFEDES
jgi:hypothetical protein